MGLHELVRKLHVITMPINKEMIEMIGSDQRRYPYTGWQLYPVYFDILRPFHAAPNHQDNPATVSKMPSYPGSLQVCFNHC